MSESTTTSVSAQEKLVTDIRAVIADAEEILRATADQTGEKIAVLRTRIQDRLLDARERLTAAEIILVDKTRAAARATDDYVHANLGPAWRRHWSARPGAGTPLVPADHHPC
jgi:ElaB/YqjD/DUF883 family membrane-anchored ribosome-binding protein